MSLTMGPHLGAVTATSRPVRAVPTHQTPATYRHRLVAWTGLDELLARTVPFVTEGVESGATVLAALTSEHAHALRKALGPYAADVRFVDPDPGTRNPALRLQRVLSTLTGDRPDRTAATEPTAGVHLPGITRRPTGLPPVRVVAEPVRTDHRPPEISEVHLHEAVLNLVFPPSTPLSVLCLYDAGALPPEVLAEARRTHPDTNPNDAGDPDVPATPGYAGTDHARRLHEHALPAPTTEVTELGFTSGGLGLVRHRVARVAAREGVATTKVDDLTVALNEVAANSLDHGGGQGMLRYWREPGALVFEVRDAGRIAHPLVGRVRPRPGQARGRGLWMAHQVSDLMQVRSNLAGTTVRVTTWLTADDDAPPAQ